MLLGYYLHDYRENGLKIPVNVVLAKKISNILIAGKSGSGKSLSIIWYIWNMLHTKESNVYIADYKGGEEYETLVGISSYSCGEQAINMINEYYIFFTLIRSNRIKLEEHYTLVIEEWFGLLVYAETKDKKLKTDLMSKVGEILAVGRGLNIGIILCVQRADANLFSSGSREQFHCVCSFGRTSSEQFRMLGYSGELEDNPTQNYKSGQALVLVDGQDGVFEIIVPYIKNPDVMSRAIRLYLSKQPDISSRIGAIAVGKSTYP